MNLNGTCCGNKSLRNVCNGAFRSVNSPVYSVSGKPSFLPDRGEECGSYPTSKDAFVQFIASYREGGEQIPLNDRLTSVGISVRPDVFDKCYWVYAEVTYHYMHDSRKLHWPRTGDETDNRLTHTLRKRWNSASEMDAEPKLNALYGCLGVIKDDVTDIDEIKVCFVPIDRDEVFCTTLTYRMTYRDLVNGRAQPLVSCKTDA